LALTGLSVDPLFSGWLESELLEASVPIEMSSRKKKEVASVGSHSKLIWRERRARKIAKWQLPVVC
jgi:hypothetical protein